VRAVLRPRPLTSIAGRRVAYFGTAPARQHERIAAHLRDEYGADVVHVSGNLAQRAALQGEMAGVDAEAFVVELKAAAVDIVAAEARRRGVDVVIAANDVIGLPGELPLDEQIRRLATEASA